VRIHRSKRPITPDEHARLTTPITIPVTKLEAALAFLFRGTGFFICAGIGIACLFSLKAFPGYAAYFLAALASILTLIGLFLAAPLPSILFAAITGHPRVLVRRRLRADCTVEIWTITARRVFATSAGDDILTWLIETDDGEYVHIYGNAEFCDPPDSKASDQTPEPYTPWIPSQITIQLVNNEVTLDPTTSGPLIPYIWLSENAEPLLLEHLSQPFITGYRLLEPAAIAHLKPLLDAEADTHAATYGSSPVA
jgi:hypothetical protein